MLLIARLWLKDKDIFCADLLRYFLQSNVSREIPTLDEKNAALSTDACYELDSVLRLCSVIGVLFFFARTQFLFQVLCEICGKKMREQFFLGGNVTRFSGLDGSVSRQKVCVVTVCGQ